MAPRTSAHIQKLAKYGAYNTVNFFRVDKGFVAQVTDIRGNRLVPLNAEQEVSGTLGRIMHAYHVLTRCRPGYHHVPGQHSSRMLRRSAQAHEVVEEWLYSQTLCLAAQKEANKNVPLEVTPEAKHDRRGILSMARWCAVRQSLQKTCCSPCRYASA